MDILHRLDEARSHEQTDTIRTMTAVLDVVQVFLCVGLIFLILMHSGKDAGLSGAFGVGTGAGPLGGGSLVERNLNRWTVLFAVCSSSTRSCSSGSADRPRGGAGPRPRGAA